MTVIQMPTETEEAVIATVDIRIIEQIKQAAFAAGAASRDAEIEALKRELREGEDLRERLSDILTRSVNAIRGEPEPLSLHSWHDLPELIEALRVDAALLDWLTAKGVEYGGGWHARENVANRGYRLHQGRVGGLETPRVAISAAIAAEATK